MNMSKRAVDVTWQQRYWRSRHLVLQKRAEEPRLEAVRDRRHRARPRRHRKLVDACQRMCGEGGARGSVFAVRLERCSPRAERHESCYQYLTECR